MPFKYIVRVCTYSNPNAGEIEAEGSPKYMASLVCIVGSKTAKVTERMKPTFKTSTRAVSLEESLKSLALLGLA